MYKSNLSFYSTLSSGNRNNFLNRKNKNFYEKPNSRREKIKNEKSNFMTILRCKILKREISSETKNESWTFNASTISQYVITDKCTLRSNTGQCYRND